MFNKLLFVIIKNVIKHIVNYNYGAEGANFLNFTAAEGGRIFVNFTAPKAPIF